MIHTILRRFSAVLLMVSTLAAAVGAAHAANRFSVATGGWATAATWSNASCAGGGATGVPAAGDNVTVCTGTTVTLDANSASIATLVIEAPTGTLNIGNSITARTLSVTTAPGTVSNAGTLQYGTAAAHVISVSGTFTNSGTFTSAAVAGAKRLTVTGLITNSGTFRFAGTAALTVNANGGISNSNVFDVDTASDVTHILNVGGDLTNNGTFDLATDATSFATAVFNKSGAGVTQTVSGTGATTNFRTITVNMGGGGGVNNIVDVNGLSNLSFTNGVVMTMTAGTFKLSSAVAIPSGIGDPTLPSGTRYWINNASASMTYAAAITVSAGAVIQIDSGSFTTSGTLTVTGSLSNSATCTSTNTLTIAGSLTNSGTFSTTGNITVTGTLQNDAGTFSATGATGVTVTGGTFNITGGAVTVGNAADERIVLTSNAATTFSMSGGTLDVAGRITNSAAAGNGSFTLSNGTITVGTIGNTQNNVLGAPFYIGSGASSSFNMSGGTIIIQQPNTLANAREYDVNAPAGTVNGGTVQIGNALTAGSPIFQVASTRLIYNLTVNGAGTPTTVLLSNITVSNNLTLTSGIVSTGGNTLISTGNCTTNVFQTNGWVAGNLRYAFPASANPNCTFHVGDAATNYTPIAVQFSGTPTAGSVTATVTNADHPDTTGGRAGIDSTKSINRYWTLSSSGAAGTHSATLTYINPGDRDGGVTVSGGNLPNVIIVRGEFCATSAGVRTCNPWGRPTFTAGSATLTSATASGILMVNGDVVDYAAGESTTARFVRQKEFIYSRELY